MYIIITKLCMFVKFRVCFGYKRRYKVAIYRNVSLTFWEDNKIVDDFTTEDRYFWLYLLTNPHTNLIGCYEVSIKQMSNETGLEISKIEELLIKFESVHEVILYSKGTKEILIKNWHKYNWTKSEKLKKPITENIRKIKSERLKKHMVSIGYLYGMDTTDTDSDTDSDTDTITVTDTDTVTDSDTVTVIDDNNIFSLIEKNFGRTLNSIEIEEIKSWEDNELTRYAIKVAVLKNKYNINYISRILANWKRNGIKTVAQAQADEEEFRKEQEKQKTSGRMTAREKMNALVEKIKREEMQNDKS